MSIANAGDGGRRRNDDDATTAAATTDVPIEPNAARREDTVEGRGVASPSTPQSDEDDGVLAESRTTLPVRAAGDATNAAAGATRRARRKDFIVVCLLLYVFTGRGSLMSDCP